MEGFGRCTRLHPNVQGWDHASVCGIVFIKVTVTGVPSAQARVAGYGEVPSRAHGVVRVPQAPAELVEIRHPPAAPPQPPGQSPAHFR